MSGLGQSRAWMFLRTVVYATAFGSLWAWIMVSVLPLDARLPWAFPGWVRVPGILLTVGGAVLALACAATFVVVGRGTPAPFDAPREFVAAGPYRWARNPMYIGGLGVLFGVGLMLQSPSACLVAAG